MSAKYQHRRTCLGVGAHKARATTFILIGRVALHAANPVANGFCATTLSSAAFNYAKKSRPCAVKCFGRASIPCECTAAHFRPKLFVPALRCAFPDAPSD